MNGVVTPSTGSNLRKRRDFIARGFSAFLFFLRNPPSLLSSLSLQSLTELLEMLLISSSKVIPRLPRV